MAFLVLVLVAALVAAFIALPRGGAPAAETGVDDLREQRAQLLRELRELDDDLAAGRISEADRAAGRRALGPRLRTVTEELRDRGESVGPAA
jgi:hypothetical protein